MEAEQANLFTASQQINGLGVRLHIIRNPTEDILATIYLQFAQAQLLSVIWHTGQPLTLREFMDSARVSNRAYYACLYEELAGDASTGTSLQTVGLAWADEIKDLGGKRIATAGMGFLPAFQARHIPEEFCHMCVDDAFQKLGIDILYGYTPLPNLAAIAFIRKAGFLPIADLPLYTTFAGQPCGVRISAIHKPL